MSRNRLRALTVVLSAALVLPVSACSSKSEDCEDAFTELTMSVEGVVSTEWDCNFQFGGGWVRSTVVLEATTEEEAIAVVDAILQAYAASPDLEDDWGTPQEYVNEDESIIVSAADVPGGERSFNGPPDVDEVREHYGIKPTAARLTEI